MTAPLSLFLTRFSSSPPVVLEVAEDVESLPREPQVTLSLVELEAQRDAARRDATTALEQRHASALAGRDAAHEAAMAQAVAAARAEWLATEAARITTLLEAANADLRASMVDRVATVLRPWLAEAAIERTRQGLIDAVDRLLGDPGKPYLRVCGPGDLLAALRDARPEAAIDFTVADTIDVTIVTDTTRIETRLAAALAAIVAET